MQQRLYEITLLLTRRGAASAAELAQRFDVSIRTIYRDIDALSSAGIPVYTERGRGGGIRLLPGYVLDKALFSDDERKQLVSHLDSLASLGTPDTDAALEKLAAIFGRADSWLEIDFAPWDGGEVMRELFRELRRAIQNQKVVEFDYSGTEGAKEHRVVEPYKILFRGQGWYLHAYSRERGAFRFFKLNRISAFVPTDENFSRTPSDELPSSAPYAGQLISVTLSFSPDLAYRVYDEFRRDWITTAPGGQLIVEATFPPGNWLMGFLLSYGSGLTVLEPEELRTNVKNELKIMLDNYE